MKFYSIKHLETRGIEIKTGYITDDAQYVICEAGSRDVFGHCEKLGTEIFVELSTARERGIKKLNRAIERSREKTAILEKKIQDLGDQ